MYMATSLSVHNPGSILLVARIATSRTTIFFQSGHHSGNDLKSLNTTQTSSIVYSKNQMGDKIIHLHREFLLSLWSVFVAFLWHLEPFVQCYRWRAVERVASLGSPISPTLSKYAISRVAEARPSRRVSLANS